MDEGRVVERRENLGKAALFLVVCDEICKVHAGVHWALLMGGGWPQMDLQFAHPQAFILGVLLLP